MLEEYERAVHLNTSILLSLLPVGGRSSSTSGISRMRSNLLREISNVVIADDGEEEGAYSDSVGVFNFQ